MNEPDDSAPASSHASPILVLTPTARDAQVVCRLLDRERLDCRRCDDLAALLEGLSTDAGPAVVAEEALDDAAVGELIDVLDRQPSWSNPPVILFIRGRSDAAIRRLLRFRNVTLLRRPIDVPTFLNFVRAAVDYRNRQFQVRDLLSNLHRRTEQLQRLTLELTESEQTQRRQIAEVLHEDLQQTLAAAKMRLSLIPTGGSKGYEVEQAADEVGQLIDEAIAEARRLSRELSPPMLRLGRLAETLRSLVGQMAEWHDLQVNIEAADEIDQADDRVKHFLFRAVQELLFNVTKHAETDRAKLDVRVENDQLVAEVRDFGRGFDPETAKRQTDRFGLLSIRERASLLGGDMMIESGPGRGSRFTLRMPLRIEEAPTPTPGDAEMPLTQEDRNAPERSPEAVLRVMLVDDHEVMRRGLRRLLEDQPDIEVVAEAADGPRAIKLAGTHDLDVIVMDASLPEISGPEAARRIIERDPHVRVIGLSMFDEAEMAAQMLAAGAETYLPKAGPVDALLQAIRGDR